MGQSASLSVTEFPSYFVRVRLSVFVPIDNVIGGLIAEDFHIAGVGTRTKCKVFLQVTVSAVFAATPSGHGHADSLFLWTRVRNRRVCPMRTVYGFLSSLKAKRCMHTMPVAL